MAAKKPVVNIRILTIVAGTVSIHTRLSRVWYVRPIENGTQYDIAMSDCRSHSKYGTIGFARNGNYYFALVFFFAFTNTALITSFEPRGRKTISASAFRASAILAI